MTMDHLDATAIRYLIEGDLNLEQRLLLSEHLSECDACLDAYLAALEPDHLLTPPAPTLPAVTKKIGKNKRLIFFKKISTVAAAACLVVGLWAGGVFPGLVSRPQELQQSAQEQLPEKADRPQLSTFLNSAANTFSNSLDSFFSTSFLKDKDDNDKAAKPAADKEANKPADNSSAQ